MGAILLAAGLGLGFCPGAEPAADNPGRPDGPENSASRSQPATSSAGINRPLVARRVVHQFTFDASEPFSIPRYWSPIYDDAGSDPATPGLPPTPHGNDGMPSPGTGARAAAADLRRAFPRWNGGAFDTSVAFSAPASVRLWAQGGNTCLRLASGVVPVFPDAEYLVSARVRTYRLVHARAALAARYLDKTGRPIAASDVRSELLGSQDTDDHTWKVLAARLSPAPSDAAFLQIDLLILQPGQYRPPSTAAHERWLEDFDAQAWFDDVTVVQRPRVHVSINAPTGIVARPRRPTLSVAVRDLASEPMTGQIIVQDAAGSVVARMERAIEDGTGRWEWTPDLPRLGWYRATLELRTATRRVGAAHVDLAWVEAPRNKPRRTDDRFALILTDLPPDQIPHLPELTRLSGADNIVIPVWRDGLTPEDLRNLVQDLAPVLERLHSQRHTVSLALPRVPAALAAAARVEPRRPLDLFLLPPDTWTPWLLPMLDKFGQSVTVWSVGMPADTPAPSNLPQAVSALHGVLARLVPGPVIALPWPGDVVPPSTLRHDPRVHWLLTMPVSIRWPAHVLSSPTEDAPTSGTDLSPAPAWQHLTAILEPLSAESFSRLHVAEDLARRILVLWGASAGSDPWPDTAQAHASTPALPAVRLALIQPWSWPQHARGQIGPHVELAVFRALSDRLSGRRVVGTFPVSAGVGYILAPADPARDQPGAVAAWRTAPGPGDSSLDAYLGPGPLRVIDLFGNESPMPAPRRLPDGSLAHRLPLTETPLFIEGLDPHLLQFMALATLDPSRLVAADSEHDLTLGLTNPWPAGIEGRITILEPGGLLSDPSQRDRSWRISPRTASFSIAPGGTIRLPLSVAFSPTEEAGPRLLIARVELTSAPDEAPFHIRIPFEIGAEGFPLELALRTAGDDLIVEAQIINRRQAPATFELTAFAPGYARLKASISHLEPGAGATRRFALTNGAIRLRGQRVTVVAHSLNDGARVTRSAAVE